MAKDEKIPNIGTSWEGYAGSRVEEFIKEQLNAKADEATTLAGYGIADAYTKTEVDAAVNSLRTDVESEYVKEAGNATGRVMISNGSGNITTSDITTDELGYLDGVAGNIQEQLNAKATTDEVETAVNGLRTDVESEYVKEAGNAASRVMISNGSGNITTSDITTDELKYLDGVSSNIQNQLDSKELPPIVLTQAQFDALEVKDENRTYFITEEEEESGNYQMTRIRIDQTISDPATMITRIVDDGGIEAIRANSHRYVGTFNGVNAMQLKQLDDTDGTKYADGTDAGTDMATLGKDVWMKLPQFWYKCEEFATDKFDFTVAYGDRPNSTYKEWDGNDLIGVYEAYASSEMLYSVTGHESTSEVSWANFKYYAQSRGTGFSLVKWKHHCMMAMLFYAQYGNTDSVSLIGYGGGDIDKFTGTTNSLGMGDTTGGGNGDSGSINFWGLENWWGNKREFVDNVVVNDYIFTITEDDDSKRTAGTMIAGGGKISKMLFGENIDLIPTELEGSLSSGFCCYASSTSGEQYFQRGGTMDYIGIVVSEMTDRESASYGSRLAFRGTIEYV